MPQAQSTTKSSSTTTKTTLVTAILESRSEAHAAVDALLRKGYSQQEISLLMTDSTRNKEFGLESGSKVGEGAGLGGVVGGTIAAAIAAIAAIGRAKAYDAGLREGGILLGVEARNKEQVKALEELLEGRGGADIKKS